MNWIIFSVHVAPPPPPLALLVESFPTFQCRLCTLVTSLWRELQPIIVERPHCLEPRPFRYKAKWQLLIAGKLITLHVLSFRIKQGAHVVFSIF